MIVDNHAIEEYRIKLGPMKSDTTLGNNGAFRIHCPHTNKTLLVIASDGEGWEHVSVSTKSRTPSWIEMCFIKDVFWSENEIVIQYHPAKIDYVNIHEHCLHLWRPIEAELPLPELKLV